MQNVVFPTTAVRVTSLMPYSTAGYKGAMLERDGFAIISNLLDSDEVAGWQAYFEEPVRAGRRNLLNDPGIRELANDPRLRRLVGEAKVVRGILFDKTPAANWAVPPHQDLNIALAQRHNVEGYGPWSVKAGVVHAVPPVDVLRSMLTIRIHLDPCGSDDGPLRVIAGTHLHKIAERDLPSGPWAECHVMAGGAVLMRPLVVHASPRAAEPTRRRVIHLEYAARELPVPLNWAFA